jgi:aromatic ring-opening dioxygenase catalytic subunit (LigB family)
MAQAHWFVPGIGVTISTAPKTIHDFGGFARELYLVDYPAPGDSVLARRIQKLLSPVDVTPDDSWGLDHATWSVLRHVYPEADIPVVQLGIVTRPGPRIAFGDRQETRALAGRRRPDEGGSISMLAVQLG